MRWPWQKERTVPLEVYRGVLVRGWVTEAYYANDQAGLKRLEAQYRGKSEALDDFLDFFSAERAQGWADSTYELQRLKKEVEE